ncbi:hypothetical protein BSNK01_27340 [Bacillaceae bacterium]
MIRHSNLDVRDADFSIFPGDVFKPILWRADFDMDFSTGCLYCSHPSVKGYHVVDEHGHRGKIAVCTECLKVNARY